MRAESLSAAKQRSSSAVADALSLMSVGTTEHPSSSSTATSTQKVDIWAFGCLFGELAKGSPLFLGEDSTTQASSHMSTSSR